MMGLDNGFPVGQHMPVVVELQCSVLRRVGHGLERGVSHVVHRKMVMVMWMVDCVGRGDMAECRGVLMEIRGKHNCVLASVSTKLPPLERRG